MLQYRTRMVNIGKLLIAAGLLVLICSCDLTEKKYYEILQLEYAEEQSENVSVYEYREILLERSTYASRVDRYYSKKQTVSFDVVITDFFQDGSVKMTVMADTLIIEENTNNYIAKGNVRITRAEGTLKTGHLIWNQNTDEVFAPGAATIVRGENILRGYELLTNTEFTSIDMKRVTAEGVIDEEGLEW